MRRPAICLMMSCAGLLWLTPAWGAEPEGRLGHDQSQFDDLPTPASRGRTSASYQEGTESKPASPQEPAPVAGTNTTARLATPQSMALLDSRQTLGPGDKVTYRVIEDQDEPRSLTVTDTGELEVPYLGLVAAAGKTSQQAAYDIKKLLEQRLYYQATVIIAVEAVNRTRVTGRVYVTGQVRNRGGFDLPATETITVGKAILNAGGFSDFSDKHHVHLVRKTPEGTKTITVDVATVWEKGELDKDPVVQAGDLIVVPARLMNY